MLWQNVVIVLFAGLICGFFAPLHWTAAIAAPVFMLVFAALGGFFEVMDASGWSMLAAPPLFSALGFFTARAWRKAHPPVPDFVAPTPPPGWRAKRQARRSGVKF